MCRTFCCSPLYWIRSRSFMNTKSPHTAHYTLITPVYSESLLLFLVPSSVSVKSHCLIVDCCTLIIHLSFMNTTFICLCLKWSILLAFGYNICALHAWAGRGLGAGRKGTRDCISVWHVVIPVKECCLRGARNFHYSFEALHTNLIFIIVITIQL